MYIQTFQNLQGYIFRILQNTATKLSNSTSLRILFLDVVRDFVFFLPSSNVSLLCKLSIFCPRLLLITPY